MKTGISVVFCVVAISVIHGFNVNRQNGQNGNNFETKTMELPCFSDLSEAENAMIVVFFAGDLSKMSREKMMALRTKWDQLQSTGKLPQCSNHQETKLQQIWRKYKRSGGRRVSKEIRAEMESVFTTKQMQEFSVLRKKVVRDGGSYFHQFFQQNHLQGKTKDLFQDLSEDENVMIILLFNGNLKKLTTQQKATLRTKWDQLKVFILMPELIKFTGQMLS
jgi:hypothetical protein